jgi:hypothetical protein
MRPGERFTLLVLADRWSSHLQGHVSVARDARPFETGSPYMIIFRRSRTAVSFGRFVLACLLDRCRTPALDCSFEAASRVHSDGPLRSCFYLSARTPVRSGGRRTQSPFPALASFTYRASVRSSVPGVLLSMFRAPNLVLTFWVLTLLSYTPHHPALAYVRPTGRASAIGFRSSHPLRTVSAFSFTRETLR